MQPKAKFEIGQRVLVTNETIKSLLGTVAWVPSHGPWIGVDVDGVTTGSTRGELRYFLDLPGDATQIRHADKPVAEWIPGRKIPDSWADRKIEWRRRREPNKIHTCTLHSTLHKASCAVSMCVGASTGIEHTIKDFEYADHDVECRLLPEQAASMPGEPVPGEWMSGDDRRLSKCIGQRVEVRDGNDHSRAWVGKLISATGVECVVIAEDRSGARPHVSFFADHRADARPWGWHFRLAEEAVAIESGAAKPTYRCETCKDSGTVAAEDADGDDYGSLCMVCRGQRVNDIWKRWHLSPGPTFGAGSGVVWDALRFVGEGRECQAEGRSFETFYRSSERGPYTVAVDMRTGEEYAERVEGEHCHEMMAARVLAALRAAAQ